MTTKELRNQASVLGIKNYTKYSKVELEILVSEKLKEQEGTEVVETIEETSSLLPSIIYNNFGFVEPTEKKETKKRKGRTISFDIPSEGTQSRRIYDYIKDHLFDKSFTVYKVCKTLNTPSNNTRRIYFKFFAEKREQFLLSQTQKQPIVYIQEEDMN